MTMDIFDFALLAAAIRLSTPLILTALGGMFSERGGVVNIALDGIMIFGAFFGAVVAFETKDPWFGLLAAMVGGGMIGFVHGIAAIRFHTDQIVSGTAINILALGLPSLFSNALYNSTSVTPNIPNLFPTFHFDFLKPWPALNTLLNDYSGLVIFTFLFVPVSSFVLYKTMFGVHLRACGENPEAAENAGIRVRLYRYYGVILGGVLAGVGGAFLSIAQGSAYVRNISAGRGFLALAALIFGKYSPKGIFFACLLFGFADAFQIRLQSAVAIPSQFIQIIPYILTVLVLIGFVGKAPIPEADGLPYKKE